MPYEYTLPEGYAEEEITGVIAESLISHREFAQRRLTAYTACCTTFELRYGMSTEAFLERFEAGTLGDQPEWFEMLCILPICLLPLLTGGPIPTRAYRSRGYAKARTDPPPAW